MLEIMKERLPQEAKIVKVKEKSGRYDLVVEVDGNTTKGSLPKTCEPDKIEYTVDFIIYTVMASAYFEQGDLEKTKYWLNKQHEMVHLE
jgi:pentatricopeptide repeat protein